ncbi:membrane-bound lytic murein transglycosylase A [Rhodobacteraceae bacterium MBR-64]
MRRALAAVALALGLVMTGPARATDMQVLSFDDLAGWQADDHAAALDVFVQSCDQLDQPGWAALCALAGTVTDARAFFELFFRPVLIGGKNPALFTGYYEPELQGSPVRTPNFAYPIYRRPPEVVSGTQWLTREEIETGNHLRGRGLEIAWLGDPVDVFFLQVQGSGRIRLTDGTVVRVGFDGRNGHPYRSIGKELVRRGVFAAEQVSARVIQTWVRDNPGDGQQLLWHNPSYIFFRELRGIGADKGPIGAMGRSITPLRTIAVDPGFTPLGAPVWIEKAGVDPMRRLMIAQDTGGAITGAQRGDIYYGTGAEAGQIAGRIRDGGRMVVLLPIDLAYAQASVD